jgi:hypothetical protein
MTPAHGYLRVGLAAFALLGYSAIARADLHYTMHTEMRQVPADQSLSPAMAAIAAMAAQAMLADGPTDVVYWMGEKGTRMEFTKGNALVPAHSVILRLADGTTVVMNPGDKTYWKLQLAELIPQAMQLLAQMNPQESVVHTGQYDVIAGVRAEHVMTTIVLDFPAPAPPTVASFPTSLNANIDAWMSDRYADYARRARESDMLLGLRSPEGGFVMKSTMRNSLLPGWEIEAAVTDITEEPAPDGAFEIPSDYKEVASPVGVPTVNVPQR